MQMFTRTSSLHTPKRREDGEWIIEVRDDGRGFDPRDPAEGLGLQIMRYRADLLGGNLTVDSDPDSGTTVRCALKIESEES